MAAPVILVAEGAAFALPELLELYSYDLGASLVRAFGYTAAAGATVGGIYALDSISQRSHLGAAANLLSTTGTSRTADPSDYQSPLPKRVRDAIEPGFTRDNLGVIRERRVDQHFDLPPTFNLNPSTVSREWRAQLSGKGARRSAIGVRKRRVRKGSFARRVRRFTR